MLIGKDAELGGEQIRDAAEGGEGVGLGVGNQAERDAGAGEVADDLLRAGHGAGRVPGGFERFDERGGVGSRRKSEDFPPEDAEVDFRELDSGGGMVAEHGGVKLAAGRGGRRRGRNSGGFPAARDRRRDPVGRRRAGR